MRMRWLKVHAYMNFNLVEGLVRNLAEHHFAAIALNYFEVTDLDQPNLCFVQ